MIRSHEEGHIGVDLVEVAVEDLFSTEAIAHPLVPFSREYQTIISAYGATTIDAKALRKNGAIPKHVA